MLTSESFFNVLWSFIASFIASFTEFTNLDYTGYAGVEGFQDGSVPLIRNGIAVRVSGNYRDNSAAFIIDGSGISLVYETHPDTDTREICLIGPFQTVDEAKAKLAGILLMPRVMIPNEDKAGTFILNLNQLYKNGFCVVH
jgi:hypothetical protein